MSFFDTIKLKDTSGTQINPATEDKQDDLLTGQVSALARLLEVNLINEELLSSILLELKKMNTHLSVATNLNIKDEDILTDGEL